MDEFESNDGNGYADFFTTGSLWIDEDRIVAHEMVHAVMAGSGINMSGMPDWFVEGSAEFLPGAIERLQGSVNSIGASKVVSMLSSSSGGSHFYSAGYAATMFMDTKIRQSALSASHRDAGLKAVFSEMQGTNLTLDTALKQVMGNNYGISSLENEFKTKGTAFINHVVANVGNNQGVGSIAEISGLDSNGMPIFNPKHSDRSIIDDNVNKINPSGQSTGFNYVLKSNTHYDTSMLANIAKTIDDNGDLKIQVGANEGQSVTLNMPTVTVAALGLSDVDIKVLANYSLDFVDNAIEAISTVRSEFGAMQNRLEHTVQNLANTTENLTAAESRIRDTDMAEEMMNFTKQNILMQAAQSMLSQANQQPQGILQLLN